MMQEQHVPKLQSLMLSQETCNSTEARKSLTLLPNAAPSCDEERKPEQDKTRN